MDNSLIAMLIIVALSALSSWLQKKSQTQERESARSRRRPPPPSTTPPRTTEPSESAPPPSPPQPETDWEKELRRLFEGEPSTPPPAPAPPPVIRPTPPAQPVAPPPLPAARSIPPPARALFEEGEGPASPTLATLTQSGDVYRQASLLHEKTAIRLRQVTAQTKSHRVAAPTRSRRVPAEITAAAALMRDPKTVRQAVVASLILEPAKGLER